MEEPELHIPPGLQRRLVAQAVSIAEQTICTSHSPRVAAWYPATSVQILDRQAASFSSTALLGEPLDSDSVNAVRKLYEDNRSQTVEALMFHRVLIPEGRSEYEWLRLLVNMIETGDITLQLEDDIQPSFGTVVGVVPTHDAAVTPTFDSLRRLRSGLVALVDGDDAGDRYIRELSEAPVRPEIILQWQDGWTIEDVVAWILKGAEAASLTDLQAQLDRQFVSIDELRDLFKVNKGQGRLKSDYLAYETVVSVIGKHTLTRERAARLLDNLAAACLGQYEDHHHISRDDTKSSDTCTILRLSM